MRTISVIGSGRIGRDVIGFIETSPDLRLGRVLSRSGTVDTADPDVFFATPAEVIIEAAGPAALRQFGARALTLAEVWTVGASALADDLFRRDLSGVSREYGNCLRLFSPWITGIGQGPSGQNGKLTVRMTKPASDNIWCGPLRDAAVRFPEDINSATAAALCGPGIDHTNVEMCSGDIGDIHSIEAVLTTAYGTFRSKVEFPSHGAGLHPTAAAIIGAIDSGIQPIRYG